MMIKAGKPVVLDDTCYMLGFEKKSQAMFVYMVLTSEITHELIDSIVFKDNKRPVTVSLLNRINIETISKKLDCTMTIKNIYYL